MAVFPGRFFGRRRVREHDDDGGVLHLARGRPERRHGAEAAAVAGGAQLGFCAGEKGERAGEKEGSRGRRGLLLIHQGGRSEEEAEEIDTATAASMAPVPSTVATGKTAYF